MKEICFCKHKVFVIIVICLLMCNTTSAQSPQKLGKVTSAAITEISGMVPYNFKKGYFWVHNDSGDGANVYLIDSTALLKVRVEIEGVKALDIEDISRFKVGEENFLILADIGNNRRNREVLSLYVIEEPQIDFNDKLTSLKVPLHREIKLKYADKRRDAEALFVDPLDNQIYILSKRDLESTVFTFPLQTNKSEVHILQPKLALPFTFTTAADISADGKYIVAKNLTAVYIWERNNSDSILETLKQAPRNISYTIEPQGEAICFDLHNRYLYTISERPFGLDSYLYKYDF
jgi:hypothetical protein